LAGVIYHDDRKPLSVWLRAQDGYASLEVRKLTSVPRAALSRVDRIRLRKWLAPLVIPLYCLLVKGLVLDGQAGIFYTLQRTYAELLLALRLFEFEQARAVARNEQKATPLIEASMSSAPSERTSGSAR
jgi:hypothetical protein